MAEIARFVSRIGSADFVTTEAGQPVATLLPCIWDTSSDSTSAHGTLVMHMARANSQWKAIETNARALAIVHGPEAYISPSNYEAKSTTHKVVPTWNYQSVHFSGYVEVSEDIDRLREIVGSLTHHHEATRVNLWQVSDSDPTYFEAQLRGIVAVTLHVDKVEAKYKLSQNRSVIDRETVIADLENSSAPRDREVAQEMRNALQASGEL